MSDYNESRSQGNIPSGPAGPFFPQASRPVSTNPPPQATNSTPRPPLVMAGGVAILSADIDGGAVAMQAGDVSTEGEA